MSDFISKWVRCNLCFRGFEGEGGMLTSCGHFICSRPGCRLACASGERTTCPVCRSTCGAVSLSEALPNEVLQFFENPEVLLRRAINVMKFHDHQKELARQHFNQCQSRITELEQLVDQLRAEKRELQESLTKKGKTVRTSVQSELVIPGIIPSTDAPKESDPEPREELFQIPMPGPDAPAKQKAKPVEPIAKLFTPTLACRLQSLTGKKMYEPVQH